MKIVAIIILSLTYCLSNAQTYHSFPLDNAAWNTVYVSSMDGCYRNFSYGYIGDTIIGSWTYSKLFTNQIAYSNEDTMFNPQTSVYSAAIREDSLKQVFVYQNNSESLYYDFSLSVGDTFCFDYFSGTGGCYPVSTVDSVLVSNSYRRRITFIHNYGQAQWIEGIGSTMGWFEFDQLLSIDVSLTCFHQNDSLLYYAPTMYCDCHANTFLDVEQAKNLRYLGVIPNPVVAVSTLDFNGINLGNLNITISDIAGRVITAASVSGGRYVIDRDDYDGGLYFYHLKSDHSEVVAGKFIVN